MARNRVSRREGAGGTGGSLMGPGRLAREYALMQRQGGLNHVVVRPDLNDLLTWHFVLHDLPLDSPYHGGVYHGKLVFPSNYPFAPPSIFMLTPSGRFEINQKLCVSMSDFHPETWSPSWRLETIVTGFLSFMLDTGDPATHGSIRASFAERRRLALESFAHNKKHKNFSTIFPEFLDDSKFDRLRGFSLAVASRAPTCAASSTRASCLDRAVPFVQRIISKWFSASDWTEKDKVTQREDQPSYEDSGENKLMRTQGSETERRPLVSRTGGPDPPGNKQGDRHKPSNTGTAESGKLSLETDTEGRVVDTPSVWSLHRLLPACGLCVVVCSVIAGIASQLRHLPVLRYG
ncbi:ubiquitin conjugating enzyme e2 [Cystoisospora suis]|uniref:Ubiquitin conjugating enzyme e2 n=1 Tax=Cystoisospora suis TaxID=483139 RepID=A0A2C6L5Q7_9APIC|nr:ubiquitin conjugating enzyme e2 [Cystoisospora suis]